MGTSPTIIAGNGDRSAAIPPPPDGFTVESEAIPPPPSGFTVEGSAPAGRTAPGGPSIPNAGAQMARDAFSKIPHELRGYTPEELAQPSPSGFMVGKTGQQATVGDDLYRAPFFDAPRSGAELATRGVEQMAQPSGAEKARGAGKVFVGGVDALSPAFAGLGVTAPVDAALWYALSKATGFTGENAASLAGANPEDAKEIGQVAEAGPLLYGGYKLAEGKFSDAIDAHNSRAAELVAQDARQGQGADLAEHITGPEIPLQNTQGWKVVPVGATPKGRPQFAVVDANGKPLYAGNGRAVQDWLSMRGVERTPVAGTPAAEPIPEPPPGFTEEKPVAETAKGSEEEIPEPPQGFKVTSPLAAEKPAAPEAQVPEAQPAPNNSVEGVAPSVAAEQGSAASAPGEEQQIASDEHEESELAALEGSENPDKVGADSDELRGRGEGRVPGTGAPGARPAPQPLATGEQTSILVPGEDIELPARYEVWRLKDLITSHNGLTFNPNPEFEELGLKNERDYTQDENQQRVLEQGDDEKFRERWHITDNPDALNGPPVVVRENGAVLAATSRTMALQMIYARNGQAANRYTSYLDERAPRFGIGEKSWSDPDQPVLVRVVDGADLARLPGGAKWAIRKTNVSGTAALSSAEQSLADAGQLTHPVQSEISKILEDAGPDATLKEALSGAAGRDLLNKLIDEGFFQENERPKLQDANTKFLTADAKDRIAKALVGQYFHDSEQLTRFPAQIKQKLERLGAPLAAMAGDPRWDLLPKVREAVDLLDFAKAHDIQNLDDVLAQGEMFGAEAGEPGSPGASKWSAPAVTLAKLLRDAKPNDVVAAFRHYVEDRSQEGGMFGRFSPEQAFQDAFRSYEKATVGPLLTSAAQGDSLREAGFYSQLERVIETKMPAKVSPQQALAILENPQHGVKADELKWTGLADWLKTQTKPLTREQILQRAQDDQVSVRESYRHVNSRYAQYVLPGARYQYTELLLHWNPPAPETPEYRAYRQIFDRLEAKYGGQRYHPTAQFPAGWRWFSDGASYYGQDPLTPEERHEYNQAVEAWDRESDYQNRYGSPRYESPHWDEKNVLAHTRFDRRSDDKGRRVLFIEEIQSDWHQEGRKKGYDENSGSAFGRLHSLVPDAPFRSTWHELVFRRLVRWAAENGYDAIAWTTGKQQAERYDLAKHVSGIAFRPSDDEYILKRWNAHHPNEPVTEENPLGSLHIRRKARRGEDPDLLDWEWHSPGENFVRASDLPEHIGKELAKKLLAEAPKPVVAANGSTRQQHELTGEDLSIGGHGMSGFYDSILPAYAAKFGKKWGAKPELTKIDATGEPIRLKHYEGPSYPIEKVKSALNLSHSMAPIYNSPFTGQRLTFVLNRVDMQRALAAVVGRLEAGEPFHEAVDQAGAGILADVLGGKVRESEQARPQKTETVHALPITDEMRASVVQQGQPLFSARKAPRLSGDDDEDYKEKASLLYHATQARYEAIPLSSDESRYAHAFVTNLSGLEYLTRNAGYADDFGAAYIDGFGIMPLPEFLGKMIHNLRVDLRNFKNGAPAVARLLAEAEHAYQNRKSLLIIADHMQAPAQASSLQEEIDHALQFAETGNLVHHLKQSADTLLTSADGRIARIHLETKPAYRGIPKGQMAAEIGVRLMRGDYAGLGLSERQGMALAKLYVQLLRQEYGDAAPRTIQKVENAGRQGADRKSADQSATDESPGSHQNGKGTLGQASARDRSLFGDSEPSLFGARENEAVAEGAARDRDQLEGERLTAQFKAPLTREEQLKKLKRSKDNPQSGLFEETQPKKAQGDLFLGSGLGAMQPYIEKFVKSDIAPTAKQAGEVFGLLKGDVLKVLAPAAVDENAKAAALSVRHRAAELQRATDRAAAALEVARKYFDAQKPEANFAFMDRVEHGEKQPRPELQKIADVMRTILDTRREAIQALGKGKLQKFIENYFPHIWKKPGAAADYFANVTKRPLEGSKSFLKKRSIDSIAAGREAGLEPVSTNPVELVLLKAREMDKYLTAQKIFDDLKPQGLLQYVDAREGQAPFGWKKIDDPAATVYGPSVQNIAEYPNEGLWSSLEKVADALGVKHARGFLNLRGAVGRASRNATIKTLHGTAEDVVAHEIGHQIDFLAGSGKRFIEEYPDAETVKRLKRARKALKDTKLSTPEERKFARQELKDLAPAIQKRKAFAKELRDLADLRSGPTEYTHKREEKMAQLAEMWVGSRELFARTAPTVFQEWKQFLDANPKLHALRDIEGNTEVTPISQPYDVGGLVIRGHWWAPEAAARILNNYLSPGLREKFGGVRAVMSLANVVNQAQLGFSGFHAVFTGLEAATSKLALAIYQLAHGNFKQAVESALTTPAAPVTTFLRGDKMLKEWFAPGTQGQLIGQLVDAMVHSGGRAHMDSFYRTHVAKRMAQAWREGNVLGALIRAPFAAFELPTRLIMEELVPRLKMGAFADMAAYELSRLPEGATVEDIQAAMAKAWDSIDNRFGQLVYDNLFWHKYVKDIALLTVRSPGWNVGDIRELAGGYADTAKLAAGGAQAAYRKLSGGGGSGSQGEPPEFTHRMAYIPAHLLVAATLGALLYYLWHGKAPEHLKDYFVPKDNHGNRWWLATYVKDEYNWSHDPARTAAGKVNPLLRIFAELATNRDYRGRPIASPHHRLPQQVEDFAEYLAKQLEPLWAEQMTQKNGHQSIQDKLLPEFGVTHASKSLERR